MIFGISEDVQKRDARIEAFIKTVDLRVRVLEPTELVDGGDAVRYNTACDYPATSDYGLVAEALSENPGLAGKRILEIGPGPGNLCHEMLLAGAAHVTGADPSSAMISYVREKFRRKIDEGMMDFVPESVYSLPFRLTFDLVVCQNTFHQLYEPLRALEGMVRATKPGGQVHIFDFRRDISEDLLAGRIAYTKPEIWRDLANSICAALTKDEFRAHLGKIPDIEFAVQDAENPADLSERARQLIAADPVPHHLDYRVSQKVTICRRV